MKKLGFGIILVLVAVAGLLFTILLKAPRRTAKIDPNDYPAADEKE